MSQLKSLSKNMLIYGGGLLLKRAISFFMIPFYTRYLTPADYGLLEILELCGFIAAFFVGFGVMHSVFRFNAQAETEEARNHIKANGFLTVVMIGGPVTVLLLLCAPLIAQIGTGDRTLWPLVILVMSGVLFSEAYQLLLAYCRAEGRAVTYAIYSLGSTFLTLSLNILFLVGFGFGVKGILYSSVTTSVLFTFVLLGPRLRGGGWRPDPKLIRQMLAYCTPFIPMGLMAFTVNFADRYFLRIYSDMTTVGIYALGYKFGMVGGMLIGTPFNLVWSAQQFEIAKSPNPRETYGRVLTYYVAALVAVCTVVTVLAREVLTIMATPAYLPAATVIPVVAWGILCLNATDMLQVGILLEKRTVWLPVIWAGSTVINLGLNFLLIPTWGMSGAAWSTLAAFAFQAGATYLVSTRLYPFDVEWYRLGVVITAGIGLQLGSRLLPEMPVMAAVALKAVLLLLCMGLLPFLPGLVKTDERAMAYRLWQRLSRRPLEVENP